METLFVLGVIVMTVAVLGIAQHEFSAWMDFYRGKRFRSRCRFPIAWNNPPERLRD